MANFFYDGMPNVNECLNALYTAFAAGPYNALPLTGGTLTGPLTAPTVTATSSVKVAVTGVAAQDVLNLSVVSGAEGVARVAIKMGYPADGYGTRIVGGADPTVGYSGYTSFETGNGPAGYYETARFTADGALLLGSQVSSGSETLQVTGSASILSVASQGAYLMKVGLAGAVASVVLYAGNGQAFGQPQSVMYVAKNSNTDRSSSNTGTVNTMGNDYAEYIVKCENCGIVAKGQIVGITADNTITDRWAYAVMFAIKSTAPSFVGGDTWAISLGPRPEAQSGPAPLPPARRPELIDGGLVTPGDTDAEWAAKQATYAAALAAHDAAMQLDAKAMAVFDAALEAEREKVDRIAIAGRVPVNVLDAQPGDYIVPVQDGAGIKGIAVRQADLTHLQYLQAVGRVISIEPDGRAYVMVKVV